MQTLHRSGRAGGLWFPELARLCPTGRPGSETAVPLIAATAVQCSISDPGSARLDDSIQPEPRIPMPFAAALGLNQDRLSSRGTTGEVGADDRFEGGFGCNFQPVSTDAHKMRRHHIWEHPHRPPCLWPPLPTPSLFLGRITWSGRRRSDLLCLVVDGGSGESFSMSRQRRL